MKLKQINNALLLMLLLIFSCNDRDDPGSSNFTYLFVPNSWYMVADGESVLHLRLFRVDREGNQEDISDETTFYYNGIAMEGNTFTTSVVGEHNFRAVHLHWNSDEEIITSRAPKDYAVISIPVIFHILYNNEPVGTGPNLSSQAIEKLIDEVNERFRNSYYTFPYSDLIKNPNHVDTKIEFRLAAYMPDGSALEEPGIVRYGGIDVTNWGTDYNPGVNHYLHLAQVMWPLHEYINISIANINGQPSTTMFPASSVEYPLCSTFVIPATETWDEYKGRYGGSAVASGVLLPTSVTEGGGVLTHELGHHLGLSHPFTHATECEIMNLPFGKYDCLGDTQFYNRNNLVEILDGFMGFRDCETDKFVIHDNIMDYGSVNSYLFNDGEKYFGFTYEQRDRMQEVLEFSPWLKELKNSTK